MITTIIKLLCLLREAIVELNIERECHVDLDFLVFLVFLAFTKILFGKKMNS